MTSPKDSAPALDWEGGTMRDVVAMLTAFAGSPAIVMPHGDATPMLDYGDLAGKVARLASGLAAEGMAGKRAALVAPNGADWIVACLATIEAGGTVVPLDTRMDAESLRHALADCEPEFLFTTPELARQIARAAPDGCRTLLLERGQEGGTWVGDIERPDARPLPPLDNGSTCVLFYTSGTTGPPKGVPLSHRNILFELLRLKEVGLMAPGERLLLPLPLHHVYPFVVGMLGALVHGAGIILPQSLTGPHILQAIKQGDAAAVVAVPRFYEALVQAIDGRVGARGRVAQGAYRGLLRLSTAVRRRFGIRLGRRLFRSLHRQFGPRLRLLASGGAALDADLAWSLEGLGWTVTGGYGLTETAPMLSILRPGDTRFQSVGQPLDGIDVRIAPLAEADDVEATAPSDGDGIGEIQVKGPNVFAGYLGLPERTAEAFTEDGWYRTEDRGRLDAEGYLYVYGRASTFVVTPAGKNVSLEELEQTYQRQAGIREIGIFLRDRSLHAVIVPETSAEGDTVETAAREAVQARSRELPSYKRIGEVAVSRQTLDRTRLGKLQRAKLQERFDAIRSGTVAATPGPVPIEDMSGEDQALLENAEALRTWELLAQRFPDRPLTPDSDVTLDLGIDSLEWINLTLEIGSRTGVELTEEATARIGSVRDLLHELVAGAGRPAVDTADLATNPERYLTAEQQRWLTPLGPVGRTAAWLLYHANRLAIRTLFRLEIEGAGHIPAGGNFVLTPNHLSVLDPFVVAAALPYATMRQTGFAGWTGIAFANPLFRLVAKLSQTLPVQQNRAAFSTLALALVMLRRGQNVVWFPEGSRSQDGRLQSFRPGISVLLRHYNGAALPVAITGTYEAMPTGRRWPRLKPVRIVFGPLFNPEAEADDAATAEALRNRVERLFDGPVSEADRPTSAWQSSTRARPDR